MAPQYGYYEDRALLQQRSNWTYVYKVDEQGKMDPPQLMLTTTYYPPNYYAPLQRTKITRIETVVRDVNGKNPYLKPKRQQVDDFGTDLREEAMKVIAAQGKFILGSNYDTGDDDYAVANMGGAQCTTDVFEYNDHRDVVRGDEVRRYDGRGPKEEGVQRSPKMNGQNGLGWYRGRVMDEQNRGNERSLEVMNLQRGGNGSYPQDHSGVDNSKWRSKPMEDGRHRGYQNYWNTQDDVGYGLYGRRHQYSGLNDDDDNGRNWWKNKPPTDEHIAGGNHGFYTEERRNFFFHH